VRLEHLKERPGGLPRRYRRWELEADLIQVAKFNLYPARSLGVRRFLRTSCSHSTCLRQQWTCDFVWYTCALCNEGAGECEMTTLPGLWSKTFFCRSRLELCWLLLLSSDIRQCRRQRICLPMTVTRTGTLLVCLLIR
jgi:hypothetical protein